ncbi:MAG TPA: ComF family protein [Abditibacteriaceae bacterium]|jgi:ComF family protein
MADDSLFSVSLQNLRKIALQTARDAIFPPRCAGCRAFYPDLFCESCHKTLQPIGAPFCLCCGTPFDALAHAAAECADCRANRYHGAPPYAALRSAYAFEGALRPAVYNFKYKGKTALAEPLSAILEHTLQSDPTLQHQNFAALVPVPLHPWRHWRRGYNQSALLAEHLSHKIGVPTLELLLRTRRTGSQVGLTEKQRLENVRGAFASNHKLMSQFSNRICNQTGAVLLIDDVCTTGATLAECARVLQGAGVAQVFALTLARQL